MIQFNVQDISEYRGQLMGIATLLVIFGHSVGNGVAMPRWMESLCGLSSVQGRRIIFFTIFSFVISLLYY